MQLQMQCVWNNKYWDNILIFMHGGFKTMHKILQIQFIDNVTSVIIMVIFVLLIQLRGCIVVLKYELSTM